MITNILEGHIASTLRVEEWPPPSKLHGFTVQSITVDNKICVFNVHVTTWSSSDDYDSGDGESLLLI
jgi:hypothetical protein